MFSINFQLLAHIKDFKLLTPRQSSFYQLRISVFKQPTLLKNKNKKPQQLTPYLILTPEPQSFPSYGQNNNENQNRIQQDTSITGRYLRQHQPENHLKVQNSQQNINANNESQSFNRMNSLEVEFHNMNYRGSGSQQNQRGQIDMETNSFLTKPFLVQKVDHSIQIDEIVVFKGKIQVTVNQLSQIIVKEEELNKKQEERNLISKKQNTQNTAINQQINKPQVAHLLTSLFVSCQLFLVSSYSTESIGQWAGYTLTNQGNLLCPITFFTYNSSYSLMEMTFLWTKIDFLSEKQGKQIDFFTNKIGSQQVNKITAFLRKKFNHSLKTIFNLPKEYMQNHKNFSFQKMSSGKKQSSKKQLQYLQQTLIQFNEKTHALWKFYQTYMQQVVSSKAKLKNAVQNLSDQKLFQFEESLKNYHWKYHVEINFKADTKLMSKKSEGKNQNQENIKFQELLKKIKSIKSDPVIDKKLVFYPFAQHQRIIKLNHEDLQKISKIDLANLKHRNQNQINKNSQQKLKLKYHLLIFVHGYQASSYDMQNLACFLKYKNPQRIKTFISSCNQSRTEQPIQQSGHRLAIQIKNYINNKLEHDKQDIEISFVCHSMGGLIVRAALKYLQLYKNKFRAYISLCSPHLGYLYHSSTLIKTSLWVLNQVKKDPSMIELSMQDNPVLEKTYLYELSKKTQLQWFKYPIFIGSRQDEYVPFWSALVQDKQFYFETKDAKIYKQLYKNLTQHIENKIIRLQTVYQDKINDISSFVGRTAHIKILNCIEIMEIIYLLVEGAF